MKVKKREGPSHKKTFEDCCFRTQSHKVKILIETHSESIIDAGSSLPETSVSTFVRRGHYISSHSSS